MEKMIQEIRDTVMQLVFQAEQSQKDTSKNEIEIKEMKKDFGKRVRKVEMKVYTLCAGGTILFGVAVWVLRSKII